MIMRGWALYGCVTVYLCDEDDGRIHIHVGCTTCVYVANVNSFDGEEKRKHGVPLDHCERSCGELSFLWIATVDLTTGKYTDSTPPPPWKRRPSKVSGPSLSPAPLLLPQKMTPPTTIRVRVNTLLSRRAHFHERSLARPSLLSQ